MEDTHDEKEKFESETKIKHENFKLDKLVKRIRNWEYEELMWWTEFENIRKW